MDNVELMTNSIEASADIQTMKNEDDKSKEIAMETVEVLLTAAITEQTDQSSSDIDSGSTPIKNDKSSSDSGVCINTEDHEIQKNNIPTDSDTDEIMSSEVTEAETLQSCTISSGITQEVNSVPFPVENPKPQGNDKDAKEIEFSKDDALCISTATKPSTDSVVMEKGSAGGVVDLGSNIFQTPNFPRHTRRTTRNYRHSTQDNDELESDERNTDNVNATEEGQRPLFVESTNEVEGTADPDIVDISMPGRTENSPAVASNRPNRIPSASSSSLFSDDDDNFGNINEDDDDDDDDDDADNITDTEEDDECQRSKVLDEVMNKPKPEYTWSSTLELMRREHGLSGDGRRSLGSGMSPGFNARFYAARHVVERMKISHCLLKHSGCVNCLNFNRAGDLLCSGSDDKRIIIWNWANKKTKYVLKSGHTENIFQTKFLNSVGVLDVVSAGRDGKVIRSILPSSGGKPLTTNLYRHNGSVHKLVMSPCNPFEIISAGEDAHIRLKDLRSDEKATSICKVESSKKKRIIRLFSISHHPYAPEICVCGCDNYVRVYDKRSMSKPVHQMCPEHLVNSSIPQVTCAVYNSSGSEVLASYSDDHIYLFNNNVYKTGEYLHCYRGHRNHKTIKGVNFFGPNSEYVISGSDCGNIFFWDKNTEAIVNFMPGDSMGVVNCLEPHPNIPVLATSGLDSSIKIWTPSSENYPPDLTKLEVCVRRNLRQFTFGGEMNGFDDREFYYYFIRQFHRRPPRPTSSSSNSSSSGADSYDLDCPQMDGIQCNTQ